MELGQWVRALRVTGGFVDERRGAPRSVKPDSWHVGLVVQVWTAEPHYARILCQDGTEIPVGYGYSVPEPDWGQSLRRAARQLPPPLA